MDLSIHDLTRRSTIGFLLSGVIPMSFNSRPHKEVDDLLYPLFSFVVFFQFTTSQGGRQHLSSSQRLFLSFNSRPHKEVDPGRTISFVHSLALSIHDLTRRSTVRFFGYLVAVLPFNSRPHKEVDIPEPVAGGRSGLSIHDLTRRSTNTESRT